MENILYVRNLGQAVLYMGELSGQISDGIWENEETDQRLWNCEVRVAQSPEQLGTTFKPKNRLDLNELDYVRDRAIETVQKIYPGYNEADLTEDLNDLTEIIWGNQNNLMKNKGKKPTTPSIEEIREAVADYMYTEGCSCCRDIEGHKKNKMRLAKLLNVPKYLDGSGYDFEKFRSKDN